MKAADITRKVLAVCLAAGISSALQISNSFAEESSIVGAWRTMIGSPSAYGQLSSSVVFTTTFAADGTYRTMALVEGGNGYQGAGGTYVMIGHYAMPQPNVLQYRLENSMLCVLTNVCSPGVPPGEQLGVVVTANVQFDGSAGLVANGQRWTRVQQM